MNWLLYHAARLFVRVLQSLPLGLVARLGRIGGAVAGWIDRRHYRVALGNLQRCFGAELAPDQIRALAREHFRRLGENYACAVRTAALSAEEVRHCFSVSGPDNGPLPPIPPRGMVAAIGHFGNFEGYARLQQWVPGYRLATTFRGLNQPALNRILRELRDRSGALYFDRRFDADALRRAMQGGPIMLGLLADQHAGRTGIPVPFFGVPCATTASPAIFAQRYQLPLHTAICFRIAPGRWRVELGPEIPVMAGGERRPPVDVMTEVNAAYERAIRRDPANWFWVHRRWRPSRQPPPDSPAASHPPVAA